MLRRRRPVATAAVVGGAAYVGSKKGAQAAEAQAPVEAEEVAPIAAPPPAASGLSTEAMEQLESLGKLHDEGILTDAEFEVQKEKILQGV